MTSCVLVARPGKEVPDQYQVGRRFWATVRIFFITFRMGAAPSPTTDCDQIVGALGGGTTDSMLMSIVWNLFRKLVNFPPKYFTLAISPMVYGERDA
jgi:hypothetical protein